MPRLSPSILIAPKLKPKVYGITTTIRAPTPEAAAQLFREVFQPPQAYSSSEFSQPARARALLPTPAKRPQQVAKPVRESAPTSGTAVSIPVPSTLHVGLANGNIENLTELSESQLKNVVNEIEGSLGYSFRNNSWPLLALGLVSSSETSQGTLRRRVERKGKGFSDSYEKPWLDSQNYYYGDIDREFLALADLFLFRPGHNLIRRLHRSIQENGANLKTMVAGQWKALVGSVIYDGGRKELSKIFNRLGIERLPEMLATIPAQKHDRDAMLNDLLGRNLEDEVQAPSTSEDYDHILETDMTPSKDVAGVTEAGMNTPDIDSELQQSVDEMSVEDTAADASRHPPPISSERSQILHPPEALEKQVSEAITAPHQASSEMQSQIVWEDDDTSRAIGDEERNSNEGIEEISR